MKTVSAEIRRLYARGVTDPAELAKRTGASRQLVHAALKRADQIGRPARELIKMSIAVPEETERWLRERSELDGCSLGDVVHALVERTQRRKRSR